MSLYLGKALDVSLFEKLATEFRIRTDGKPDTIEATYILYSQYISKKIIYKFWKIRPIDITRWQ